MSGPLGSQQWMYSTGFYPYEIDQSLRFNDDDTAYLNRTPASAGNRKTWTLSFWHKMGSDFSDNYLFEAFQDYSNRFIISFYSDNTFFLAITGSDHLRTSAIYRDPSAWYHFVIKFDTTQATQSDRVKFYVNGNEETLTATLGTGWPSQNSDQNFNSTMAHYIGRHINTTSNNLDGYMAEINFVDGQALDPTSFGEFKSGVWIPKSYSGSYGTNGFYLDFGNSGSLGADSSGNGNNWTANNLAATDQVLDSPTNNFATLNPLDKFNTTLSDGNLNVVLPPWLGGSNPDSNVSGTIGVNSGKWYWEVTVSSAVNSGAAFGVARAGDVSTIFQGSGVYYQATGSKIIDGSVTSYGATYTTDVIGIALNLDAGTITFYKNNSSQGAISLPSSTNGWKPKMGNSAASGSWTVSVNFGQSSFAYTPPASHIALNTANLPDPAIDPAQDDVPEDYFNTVLWTGDGTTSRDITGVGFQPDWVWYKKRSAAFDHNVFDSVRGAGKLLESSTTSAESTTSDRLNGFVSDGFNVGNNSGVNASSATYVAWNWLAGNGTSTNTDGTITSTVSANQKAGFSIVSYTGNGTNPGATIGHGLSAAPDMIIAKSRSATGEWPSYHSSLPVTNTVYLNATYASSTYQNRYSAVSSTTFTTGSSGSELNANGVTYIAYCFHSVEGYSKFGSYTGNGSSDGPFVYTGFRPAFVLWKNTGGIENWHILDTVRDDHNVADHLLRPNLSNAEAFLNDGQGIDILSNGFKPKVAGGGWINASGNTFIYMAFAEMPFKYSLGR